LASGSVTASKIDVSSLSAITANLWDVHVWNTTWSGSWIRIYPYTSTQWRMDFYYDGDLVWEIRWAYVSWVWDAIYIIGGTWWGYIVLWGITTCLWKLRIPVWTDLYE
jgi:hypothetical protein